jgi:predicted DCC family thiol-disulfide oxidoreductase YuxK
LLISSRMSNRNMSSKVYYNSACPVCNAGIKDQRRRMEACGIKDIEWIDVHTHPEAVADVDAPLEAVRERLRVRNPDGKIDVGVDAFIRLWSQTPGQRWLARIARIPVLKQLVQWGYNAFARRLYRWNRAKRHW